MRYGILNFPHLAFRCFLIFCVLLGVWGNGSAQVVLDTAQTTIDTDTASTPADTARADTLSRTDTLEAPDNSALESPVQYQAQDSIRFDLRSKKIYLFDQAEVDYERLHLEAGKIIIHADSNLVYAEGVKDSTGKLEQKPVFEEGPDSYRARRMVYNFKSEKGKIYEIATEEGEGLVYGDEVKKDAEGTMYIEDARYTTCKADHPHFFIKANRIKVIPKDKIISGPAQLVLGDVPLPLVVPFGFFPNSSQGASGVVIPKYGESLDQGFFLREGGVFLRISDHFNSLTQGDVYTKGSWRVNQVFRYKKRYGYEGNFDFNYARNRFGDPESPDFTDQRNYFLNWQHRQSGKARPGVNFNASVNVGSSSYLQNNSFNNSDIVRNNLSSSVSFDKRWLNAPFNLNVGLTHNQDIANQTMSLELPRVVLGLQRVNPFERQQRVGEKRWYENIGFTSTLNLSNQADGPEDRLFDADTSRFLWRNGASINNQVNTNFKVLQFFTLSPSISHNYYLYTKRRIRRYLPEEDTIVENVETGGLYDAHSYNFNTNLNTRLYGMFNVNRLGVQAVRHVLTPTVGANYRPDFARTSYGGFEPVRNAELAPTAQSDVAPRNLEAYSIFYQPTLGAPGQGEQGSLTFGLQNNLEMKVNQKTDTGMTDKKVTLVDALSINSGYNFLADSQKLGNFRLSFRTRIVDKYDIQANAVVNPYAIAPDSAGTIDAYVWDTQGQLGRLTSFDANFGANYRSLTADDQEEERYNNPYYRPFRAPWNVGVRYQLRYSKPLYTETITQQLQFNGRLDLTQNWTLQGTSGYDITNETISFTSVNITRDLHCWEFSVNWIPFGQRRRYYFSLNVKASVLQDLKLDKRKEFFDFTER